LQRLQENVIAFIISKHIGKYSNKD